MAMPYPNDLLTERIIGFGPGLLESAYEECLCHEMHQNGLVFQRQVPLPTIYKTVRLDCGYRMDIVVDDRVIVELKTVERLMPIHDAQVLTYMKLSGIPTGLLLNFNTSVLILLSQKVADVVVFRSERSGYGALWQFTAHRGCDGPPDR